MHYMGFLELFGGSKKLEEDNKKLMSDGLKHKSSLAGQKMNQRKQELKKKRGK